MLKLQYHIAVLTFLSVLLLADHPSWAQVFTPLDLAVSAPDTIDTQEVKLTPEAKKRKAATDLAKRTEHVFHVFDYHGIPVTRPGKAAILATIFPGAGQIYNRAWWKLPLVYGALGGLVYSECFFQKGYREFADAANTVSLDETKLHNASLGPRASLYNSKAALDTGVEYYRDYRDTFFLYIGLAYGLQIMDSLVDAHLKEFDVSDDLSLRWKPTLLIISNQSATFLAAPGISLTLQVKGLFFQPGGFIR